ncbi:MAG: SDR family oxidoreductase [Pseudomonadota bacterium]
MSVSVRPPRPPIAVVGVSAIFPGSLDATGFWRDILAGTDLICDVPPGHWLVEDYYDPDPATPDKTHGRRGGFLPAIDFDVLGFGVPPSILPSTDTAQLLALIVAQRVLQDAAGDQFEALDRSRISVILGVTSAQELYGSMVSRLQRPVWTKALREAGLPETKVEEACRRIAEHYVPWQESSFPGLLGNVVAGRIANRLDLGGTNCVTDAACASTLSALSMALNELYLGDSDLVITGGVDAMNDILMFMCFSKTQALSISGDCRPFSDQADGTLLGEGLGMVALKRLEDAERDGDRIYALICGLGASSDGRAASVYAPVAAGQAQALRRAYQAAGYPPGTVELVEAHGTGTKAGDAAEFAGLSLVFGEGEHRSGQHCALGSVKSQIGHTKAAAGAAGLFKAIMALHHRVLPPTIKVDRPNPALGIERSPFYLNTRARPWVRGPDHPRRAGVSSFGFGGSNFHVTLQEYPGSTHPRLRTFSRELVLLGGANPQEIAEQARAHAAMADQEGFLPWLATSSQAAFDAAAPCRLAIIASRDGLSSKLQSAAERVGERGFSTPDGVHYGTGPALGGVAFLFPGQGSQYLGMGREIAMTFGTALAAWDRAAELELHTRVFPPPAFTDEEREAQARRLTSTRWAQPAIGCTSLSLLALLAELGLRPGWVGGHSFGELVALHVAGVLSEADLLRVACARGELMEAAAATPGAMTAVQGAIDQVRAALEHCGGGVVVANHNSPSQVVLSGPVEAIARIEAVLVSAGLLTTRLPVATAFHSPLVSASAEPFAAFLEEIDISPPAIPVFANATAAPYPGEAAEMRALLAGQIARPVRFVEMIEAMYASGARTFVEVGPGAVLTGLTGSILGERPHLAVELDRRGRDGVESLWLALGRLAAAGHPLDFATLTREYGAAPDPALQNRPAMAVPICGANHGKPYPPVGGVAALPPPNPECPLPIPESAVSRSEKTEPRPPTAASTSVDLAWLAAYQEAQRQTAEAHAAYQRAMADTHTAFLRVAETGLAGLAAVISGQPLPALAMSLPVAPALSVAPALPAGPPPLPEILSAPPPPLRDPAPVAPRAPVAVAEPAPARDLQGLLLGLVAEKKGYPVEMLRMDMDLEADLGVDSIKRVEILSAVQERAPELPEVNASLMASLRTLEQICAYLANGPIPAAEKAAPALVAAETKPTRAAAAVATAAGAPAAIPPELGRFVLHSVPAPALGMTQPGIMDAARVVVTDDGAGTGQALVTRLEAAGIPALLVEEVPLGASAVVFLGGLRSVETVDDAIAVNREAFRAAQAAGRSFLGGGLFVCVQDLGGCFGLSPFPPERAWLAGLAGLARTAMREWPACSVKVIDLERGQRSPDALAYALLEELLRGGPELEVGLGADGERRALRSVEVPNEAGLSRVGTQDVLVVSGGARGVTAACVVALAQQTGASFALLGRTPLSDAPPCCAGIPDDAGLKRALLAEAQAAGAAPTPAELGRQVSGVQAVREVRRTLEALRASGARARYYPVDVVEAAAVASVLDRVRVELGPITGLVHGAGTLADRHIVDQTAAQFDRVFDTKVLGFKALLEASAGDPLRLLVVFSSVTARCGNLGQADYAMANEVLNKVAVAEQRRRGPACLVRALGWGPWDGGMVTPELRAHFLRRGVPLLPLDEGARLLVDECASVLADQVELVLGSAPWGMPVFADSGQRGLSLDLVVSRHTHPFLAGHAIEGTPVLPAVLALEWFVRAARALRPELRFVGLRDLRILRGIPLLGFDNGGDRLRVSCTEGVEGDDTLLGLELRGADGALHYSATVELAERLPEPAPSAQDPTLDDWGGQAIYDDVLFHTDTFRLIQSVQGVSDEGISGTLTGVHGAGWPTERWQTDAAALDGGLQLALLWTQRVLGGASLPTSVGQVHAYTEDLSSGPVRCVLRGRRVGALRTLSDLVFFNERGDLIFELRDVEAHLKGSGLPNTPLA